MAANRGVGRLRRFWGRNFCIVSTRRLDRLCALILAVISGNLKEIALEAIYQDKEALNTVPSFETQMLEFVTLFIGHVHCLSVEFDHLVNTDNAIY